MSARKAYLPRPALIPRGLGPKMSRDQLRDLALCHLVNLDAIASGSATPAILCDWAESVLVWSQVADRVGGSEQMSAQADVAANVIARFRETGTVFLTDEEIELAREGVAVMDALAETVDQYSAIEAVTWARLEVMKAMQGAPA